MVRVIFLDLASATGVAHAGPVEGAPSTHLLKLPKVAGSGEEGREYGNAYKKLREHLVGLIALVDPTAIGFEAAINTMFNGGDRSDKPFRSAATLRYLLGLVAVVEETAATFDVACYEAANSTIKKHITGNHRAQKQEVIAAVERLGWDVGSNDNRADAAAGWSYLMSQICPAYQAPLVGAPLFRAAR